MYEKHLTVDTTVICKNREDCFTHLCFLFCTILFWEDVPTKSSHYIYLHEAVKRDEFSHFLLFCFLWSGQNCSSKWAQKLTNRIYSCKLREPLHHSDNNSDANACNCPHQSSAVETVTHQTQLITASCVPNYTSVVICAIWSAFGEFVSFCSVVVYLCLMLALAAKILSSWRFLNFKHIYLFARVLLK